MFPTRPDHTDQGTLEGCFPEYVDKLFRINSQCFLSNEEQPSIFPTTMTVKQHQKCISDCWRNDMNPSFYKVSNTGLPG